jgi:transcriptional regulator with PAS, ATPase and Fis domain
METEICFISPYHSLTRLIQQCLPKENYAYSIIQAALANAEKQVVSKEQNGTEVFITTEGNARHFRKVLKKPIITFPMNPFDTILVLYQAKKNFGYPVALFEFAFGDPRVKDMAEMLQCVIKPFIYLDRSDAQAKLSESVQHGCKAVVCGGLVAELAKEMNIPCLPIGIGNGAIAQAYQQAQEIAKIRRQERKQTFTLNAVVNSVREGILVIDHQNVVTLINPTAEKILNIPSSDLLNRSLEYRELQAGLKLTQKGSDQLRQIGNMQLVVSNVSIQDNGQNIGTLISFQEADRIKCQEEKIRLLNHAQRLSAKFTFDDVIGTSSIIKTTVSKARNFSVSDETILIIGETGTGKEIFAQGIHNASLRRFQPFMAINCSAIPANLLESELFGYVEGAFTGAKKGGKPGLFELAHRGTVFLDEIGEMPLSLQSRLLRVLQEKEVMRVGDVKIIPVDVRIIAATNVDLQEAVNNGSFRRDLYYRLNVLELYLPPLRKRLEDIPLIINSLLDTQKISFEQEVLLRSFIRVLPLLQRYTWPGNIRELLNLIKRVLVLLHGHDYNVSVEELIISTIDELINRPNKGDSNSPPAFALTGNLKVTLDNIEANIIADHYYRLGGDKEKLANILGVGRTTLWRKLSALGLYNSPGNPLNQEAT